MEENTNKELSNSNENNMKDLLVMVFWCFLIFYLAPSLIVLIYNFLKLVIFGDYKISEFDWQFYSYQKVNNFYLGIKEWFEALSYRLQH